MMDLEKFKELLSVPTKTYDEDRMVEYLINNIGNMSGVKVTCDEYNNIYVTKGKLNEGEFYPMFVAHTDTVHEIIPKINVKEVDVYRPVTFGKIFESVSVKALKAYDDNDNPTGIGGDDKCGIFICLNLLETLEKVKIGLFVSEETGCHGSSKCNEEFLKDVGYICQYDAPGDHLITEVCSGVRLFEKGGEFGSLAHKAIKDAFGCEMTLGSHPYTDVMQLKKKSDVSCINMSCGYYNMHTANEFVCVSDVERAIQAGLNMVNSLGLKKYEFKYEPIIYNHNSTLFNIEDEDENPFYDKVHQLASIDIIEEKDGIIITDFYDDNNFFIDDEDGYKLYEILKNRYSLD